MKKTTTLILVLAAVVIVGILLFSRFGGPDPERRPDRDSTLVQLENFIDESPNDGFFSKEGI